MWLGLPVFALRVLQCTEIVQGRRHIQMHRSQLLLAKRQSSLLEWSGVGELALLGELVGLLAEAIGLGEVLGPRGRPRPR